MSITRAYLCALWLLVPAIDKADDAPHYTVTIDVYVKDADALCEQAWGVALERLGRLPQSGPGRRAVRALRRHRLRRPRRARAHPLRGQRPVRSPVQRGAQVRDVRRQRAVRWPAARWLVPLAHALP
jgi:hypothetical protein